LLGALEKKGQIERDIDKSNRRNILVSITNAGRERILTEMTTMTEAMTRIFAEMGEADTLEFVRLTNIFFTVSQKHMMACEGDERNPQSG
jgi:DNA-binding MarR family transcriptional regulator